MEEKDFKKTVNELVTLMVGMFIMLMICMYAVSICYDEQIEKLDNRIKTLTEYSAQESKCVRKLISDNYNKMERLVDGYSCIITEGGWE